MRGHGKRRSTGSSQSIEEAGPSVPAVAVLREGGIRRKTVPSTVMESPDSPRSQEYIDQSRARSSVARDFDREDSPPTPEQDDTPYIRFAIDQLTRDEEVRGSRVYPGEDTVAATAAGAAGIAGPAGVAYAVQHGSTQDRELQPAVPGAYPQQDRSRDVQQSGSSGYPAVGHAYREEAYPLPSRLPDQPPPRSPHRFSGGAPPRDIEKQAPLQQRVPDQRPDPFICVPNDGGLHTPLTFFPGTLRPLSLSLFILFILTLTALLIASAILSFTRSGLADYGYFGDSTYFVFEYLPTLLGVILFFWIVQIQVTIYRIAPFISISSDHPRAREEGAKLPIYPKTFLFPYLGHFRAKQPLIGLFMFVAWLQIWTLPLLASSYNVYFYGPPDNGHWRWIATQGAIWAVIGLYILLLFASTLLLISLRNRETGLRWDPRSLADLLVLLERSNALSASEDEELRHEAPRLGYWRTQRSNQNEIFHSYGVADKPARQYGLGQDGRIVEKLPLPPVEPKSRYDDPELELAREQRHSREKMLPRHTNSSDLDDDEGDVGGRAVPWFLRSSAALLWAVAAFVLLLAFLIISYLPSTAVADGFAPAVPAPVSTLGFSGTNFLYSFVPTLLATICLLGWLDIDYAHRRLQPLASLIPPTKSSSNSEKSKPEVEGELAERSILTSYPSALPFLATGAALVNGHFLVALASFLSPIAASLPILGGGCFWAQFYVPTQNVRIAAHMPAYYALSVFVGLYAVGCVGVLVMGRRVRSVDRWLPAGNSGVSFEDILSLVRRSKALDDIVFRNPISKIDLVTRLLSAEPGYGRPSTPHNQNDERLQPPQLGANPAAGTSKVSVADSVRGFGRARERAEGFGGVGVARWGLGRWEGRDGRGFVGLDRVRA